MNVRVSCYRGKDGCTMHSPPHNERMLPSPSDFPVFVASDARVMCVARCTYVTKKIRKQSFVASTFLRMTCSPNASCPSAPVMYSVVIPIANLIAANIL